MLETTTQKPEKKLDILLVGQVERDEFTDAVRFLNRLGEVHLTPRLEKAIDRTKQGKLLPELVVLLASRPGEFLDSKVNQLRTAAPLARLVNLLGSWCEGEMRTGVPLSGMVRLYWHEWEPACERELARLGNLLVKSTGAESINTTSTWSMPVTSTDEERLLVNRPITFPRGSGLVAINSPSPAMSDWMAEACEKQGYSVVLSAGSLQDKETSSEIRGVSVVIVDASECNKAEQARIKTLQTRWPSARMIVLLDFPRIEQRRRLQEQGVDTIVSKPITLEGLLWHVQQLVSSGTVFFPPATATIK